MTWENRDASVSLDQAAAIPFSTLGIRIDGGREQMMVLATDIDDDQLWTSSAHIALQTRGGRIASTAGFGNDLTSHASVSSGPEEWNRPHHYTWSADFADLGIYSVRIECDVRPIGPAPMEILGKTFNTFRADETCTSPLLDWTFTNSYWVSADSGRVWRSIQHFHPKGPQLELEVLRPPLSYQ
jgi:hypothetical protein